jgi:hypothetical protein
MMPQIIKITYLRQGLLTITKCASTPSDKCIGKIPNLIKTSQLNIVKAHLDN